MHFKEIEINLNILDVYFSNLKKDEKNYLFNQLIPEMA